MKSHADCLKRAISDLGRIDVDLIFAENAPFAQGSEEELLLKQLKAAVDSLRTSMWCRMRAAKNHDAESKHLLEFQRMRSVTNQLRQARSASMFERKRETSIIERFEHMAEATLRDHANNSFRTC